MRARASAHLRSAHRRTTAAAALVVLAGGLAGCSATAGDGADGPGGPDAASGSESVAPDPVRLSTSYTDAAAVAIDDRLTVSADGGTLDDVEVLDYRHHPAIKAPVAV